MSTVPQSLASLSYPTPDWPGETDYAPWPSPYRAYTDECTETEPRLPRRIIMELAPVVTDWYLDDDQTFAKRYGVLAALFQQRATTNDLCAEYLDVLRSQLNKPPAKKSALLDAANQHDIANIHRAVWLRLFRAIACIMNINLHGDWGDPPAGGASQGYEGYAAGGRTFHTNPNAYGSYAVSTLDIAPPDLGIGEASEKAIADRVHGDPLPSDRVRAIARALGRGLVDPDNGDEYLRVVKSFYRDRLNHTRFRDDPGGTPGDPDRSYTGVIVDILKRTSANTPPPETLSDDDVANLHRGAWLFLAHRFCYLVGKKAFGPFEEVHKPTRSVSLPIPVGDDVDFRVLEVPNPFGEFTVNLKNIDPDDDP